MFRRTRAASFGLAALACAAPLICRVGLACDAHYQEGYVSPGLLLSFAFKEHTSFGLGGEVSYNELTICETSSDIVGYPTDGFGAFLNGVYYVGTDYYARLAAGGQANALLLGAEAGWSYVSRTSGADVTGPANGPYLGAFLSGGYLMLALRGTFPTFGDERRGTFSLDLAVKAPVHVSGR